MTATLSGLVARLDGAPVAVSRATSSNDLAIMSASTSVVTLPITGGLTVWESAPAGVVPIVMTPNHLGVTDRLPTGDEWIGVRRSEWIEPHPRLVDEIAPARVELREIRRLATRLSGIAGIGRYHSAVDARWFTLIASDPMLLTITHPQVHAATLGRAFADVPGGVRVEVGPDATESDLGGYAAAVEGAALGRNRT